MRKNTYKLAFTLVAFGVILAILNRWISFNFADYKTISSIIKNLQLIGYPLPLWLHNIMPIPTLLTKLLHFFLLALVFRRIYLILRSQPIPKPNYLFTFLLIIFLSYFIMALIFTIFASLGNALTFAGTFRTHIIFDGFKFYQNLPFIVLIVEMMYLFQNHKKN